MATSDPLRRPEWLSGCGGVQATSGPERVHQPESGTGWLLPETTDHSIHGNRKRKLREESQREAPARERELPVGVTGSCGLWAVAWGPAAGMWNGVLVFAHRMAKLQEMERVRVQRSQQTMGSYTHAHAGTCAQKPAHSQPACSHPGAAAHHTQACPPLPHPLSDNHNFPYEDCYSRYLIISFDMNNSRP